jgi:hypothetical protein
VGGNAVALDTVAVKWGRKRLFLPMQTLQVPVRWSVHYGMDVWIATKVMKILVLRHQVPFLWGTQKMRSPPLTGKSLPKFTSYWPVQSRRWTQVSSALWIGCQKFFIGQFSLDVHHKCTMNRVPKVLAHAHAYCQECSCLLPLRAMFVINALAYCHWHVYGRKCAHVYC